MTLAEHLQSADRAWRKIDHALKTEAPAGWVSELRATLRDSARQSFWLYPLIEGRRGLPGL